MSLAFNAENRKRIDTLVAKYEQPQSALLPLLYIAQEQFGFLSSEALELVAKELKVPTALAHEAASFYTMFKKQDMGKWFLQVCNNVTCTMMGSEDILKVVQEELGLKPGEVTSDGLFGLSCVQCLGSCDTAPVVQVNDDYIEKLDPEKFRSFLKKLKNVSVGTSPLEAYTT